MKYLQFTTYYERALNQFYDKFALKINSTSDILKLIENEFIESHRWPYYLDNKKFDIKNIIVNSVYFQELWAKENSINFDRDWKFKVAFHQIEKYKPDIIFITSESFFSFEALKYIKQEFKFVKNIILWQGILNNKLQYLKKFHYIDKIFTSSQDIRNQLKDEVACSQIHYAFDNKILKKIDTNLEKKNLTFIGSIYLERQLHGERAEYLNYLIRNLEFNNLNIFSNVNDYNYMNYAKNFLFKLLNLSDYKDFNFLKELKFYREMNYISRVSSAESLFGINQFKKLNEYLILINKHINGLNFPANIRLFEGPGVGCCLITDFFDGLKDLFDVDNEIITFKNKDDLLEKVNYLQKYPEKAIEIGKKSQQKILKMHTYEKRVLEFEEMITSGI